MRLFAFLLAFFSCAVMAEQPIYGNTSTGPQPFATNTAGNMIPALSSFEDTTNSVAKVEQQFSYCANKAADAQCGSSGARFVHAVTCTSGDAAATAGDLAIRDAVAAGAGTIVLDIAFAAAYFPPVTIILDQTFSTGIYLDFTTTADVNCTVSYR